MPTRLGARVEELQEDIGRFYAPHRSNTRFIRSTYFCHFAVTPQPKLRAMWQHIETCDICRMRYDRLAAQPKFHN